MADEKKEVKPKSKPKNQTIEKPAPAQTLDVSPVIEALKAKAWTAEKHRGNPQFVVGVVLNNLVPKIIELLD